MVVKSHELAKDIFAFAVILARLGYYDENDFSLEVFAEMVNQSGFRTVSGKEFSSQNLVRLMRTLPDKVKQSLKDEFSESLQKISGQKVSPLETMFVVDE